MADHGVAITWGEPKGGREKASIDLFGAVTTIIEKAVTDGRIASWDVVFFEPAATPPDGAMRIYGTREQVEAFISSEDFTESLQRATLLLHHVGLRRFFTGAALLENVGQYTQLIDSL